jgi:hypothetical protein
MRSCSSAGTVAWGGNIAGARICAKVSKVPRCIPASLCQYVMLTNSGYLIMLTLSLIVQDSDGNASIVGSLHVVLDDVLSFIKPFTYIKWITILITSDRNDALACLNSEWNWYGVVVPTMLLESLHSFEDICGMSWNITIFLKRHCYQSWTNIQRSGRGFIVLWCLQVASLIEEN